VIGLRESGLTYEAIAAQTGLSQTGVFNICRRFADHGLAGLQSGPRGPAPGTGRLLDAAQEAEIRGLICRHMPDELGLPFALFCLVEPGGGARLDRTTLRRAFGGAHDGDLPGALGLYRPEAVAARL
jgi:hypothetical protein